MSPNFSARMGSAASPQRTEAQGPPHGGCNVGPSPSQIRRRQEKAAGGTAQAGEPTTAGGRWWDTPGSRRPPWRRRRQKPAWSKATELGDRWRLDGSPGTGCRSRAEGKGQRSGLSMTLAAASSWQPPAWPAGPLPAHTPPPPGGPQMAKGSLSITEDKGNGVLQGWGAYSPMASV